MFCRKVIDINQQMLWLNYAINMSCVRWDLARKVLRSKAAGGPSSPAAPALPEVNQISWQKVDGGCGDSPVI